jgi:hypothetical protein
MEFKNELLNDMFDEHWNSINLYHFLNNLTSEELIRLTWHIENMGYYAYYYGDAYVFNPQLLYMISIITKKKKFINDNYYMAIRYFVEMINETDIKTKDINMLISLLIAMDPNDFSNKPEKIFI